ncbi:methionyl-tRNA formyltransferase [Candidatus Methylacidiphilum infernorum]|uniref:Methionyl-tRNA formyltransferase n=1 Tax=Methylacidiphilum infernorum (isolate V4) TaxID=481448 RepID=FMT_METI4|nr:methionyl-tRNA formyltransferase [Candidatus Methylacidiphilum infernorum]B3DXI7.1 RecName: Full=Methionyl-tRNA formyltransferase [Methylacidiphilum infernorum V4]ACD82221.1 Methionyl-tRNA formyltransferase [Methylacidiphilum infernorum V4]
MMRVVFIGTGDFGVPSLEAIALDGRYTIPAVVTQADKPLGRQKEVIPSPIKRTALKHHIWVFQPENINSAGSIQQIQFLKPDLLVVCDYGQILSKAVLEIPSIGALNIHGSLLPKYRGASPIQAAIMNRDKETGVTVIWMDEGIDTGDILMSDKLLVRSTDTAETLHHRLAELGARLIIQSLEAIRAGKAPRIPQNNALASYAKKIKKEQALIDWTKDRHEIDAMIRAFNPWPVAFTTVWIGGEKKILKIFKVIISHRAKGMPGEVVRIDRHGILVAAGRSGGLLLREVQLEGRKRMHAADFARGARLAIGTVLGQKDEQ